MINRLSIKKKVLRTACAFSLMVLGMWFLSACDSVKDAANDVEDVVSDIFEMEVEDITISLNDIIVQKTPSTGSEAPGEDCGTYNVESALKKLESKDERLKYVEIKSIEFNYVDVSYSNASWTPESETLTCKLTITGPQNTEIAETDINGASGTIDVNLTDEQIGVINYYLSNRSENFEYCVECDNALNFDTYSVTYSVDINVDIKGSI